MCRDEGGVSFGFLFGKEKCEMKMMKTNGLFSLQFVHTELDEVRAAAMGRMQRTRCVRNSIDTEPSFCLF